MNDKYQGAVDKGVSLNNAKDGIESEDEKQRKINSLREANETPIPGA